MKMLYARKLTAWSCLCSSLLASAWLLAAETSTEKQPTAEDQAFFESKIRPLLIERCVDCHCDDAPESGLSLESRAGLFRGGELGPAVVPGKPRESLLISAINHDEFLKMPPKEKLSTIDLVNLSEWVRRGAPWPISEAVGAKPIGKPEDGAESDEDPARAYRFTEEQLSFWAYQPVRRPVVPAVRDDAWVLSPIDAFVLQDLEARGMVPAPVASKRDLIRRATYDLIGLPPSEKEVVDFLNDDSPQAFANVVDRLLASPRYGEKWGRHWLDVARFADSNGLDENIAYANAFRYRDYVISSFNADKPFDRFVREQIAGDLLPAEPGIGCENSREALQRYAATGFLAIGAKMLAEDDPMKMQMDIVDEQLNTLCQAFMGMTIGCARCHDHKFDPLPTADYYSLAGIFKSTRTMENFKVVAKWFERPLATPDELQRASEIQQQIDATQDELSTLQKACQKRSAKDMRDKLTAALLATTQLRQWERLEQSQPASDGGSPNDDAVAREPFAVRKGYARIEAEGFQRGSLTRDMEHYGQGIGVVLSDAAASAEYDLQVEHAGRYVLEMRYAADDRRPVRLLVNGVEVAEVASRTTGSWQPEGQAWFVETVLDLQTGRNVLKFDSQQVFPHIDKFALILSMDQAWPVADMPASLTKISREHGLSPAAVIQWRDFLTAERRQIQKVASEPLPFAAWLRFADIEDEFESAANALYNELNDESSTLAKCTAEPLRQALLAARPQDLRDVAEVYQRVLRPLLAQQETEGLSEAEQALRQRLLQDNSPLRGPADSELTAFYLPEERLRSAELTSKLETLERRLPELPMAMGVDEGDPQDIRIHLRGSHIVLGERVPRRFPRILAGDEQPALAEDRSGRLEFAEWVAHPNHPLTSRVFVNRCWYWHFGRGIVSSVDNFGFLGQRPTHPELLDWLAAEFVDSGWSIKKLHRRMMLTQTYQMSTHFNSAAEEIDPENQWLHRFRRRRLSAEETRDSIIVAGKGLDMSMFGSMLDVENHKYVNSTRAAAGFRATGRRSVYLPVIRSGVYDVLQTLDFPDPSMINGRRQTSTVAPQALLMMNSDLVGEQTRFIAEWLLKRYDDDGRRISAAYRQILKRPPDSSEVADAAMFLRDGRALAKPAILEHDGGTQAAANPNIDNDEAQAIDVAVWQAFCRVLISSNEFSYIE